MELTTPGWPLHADVGSVAVTFVLVLVWEGQRRRSGSIVRQVAADTSAAALGLRGLQEGRTTVGSRQSPPGVLKQFQE